MSEVELFPGYVSPLGPGTIPHEDLANVSGLELLQRIVERRYPSPIAARLNFGLAEVAEAHGVSRSARRTASQAARHRAWRLGCNAFGFCVGLCGADAAGRGEADTTAEFKVNLTRSITPKTGEVVCEGRVVHKGQDAGGSGSHAEGR
jgi:hypothetical protein